MEQKTKKIKVRYMAIFEYEMTIPDDPTFTSDDILDLAGNINPGIEGDYVGNSFDILVDDEGFVKTF